MKIKAITHMIGIAARLAVDKDVVCPAKKYSDYLLKS